MPTFESIWQPRIVPAVMIGSFVGAGLGTLPFEVAFYLHFVPFFLWIYWRLIFWKNHPETRLNTVVVPLSAAMVVVAIVVSSTSRR